VGIAFPGWRPYRVIAPIKKQRVPWKGVPSLGQQIGVAPLGKVPQAADVASSGLYQVVRAEAGPETRDGEIACRVCGAPLASRDGEFVLKYFLLRKASRQQVWQKRRRSIARGASPLGTRCPDA
jgi:hypothetical protein